jgi:hypothetical protein
MSASEASVVRVDAALRLAELKAVRDVLWSDREDPAVMSELVTVQSQIRSAEQALAR